MAKKPKIEQRSFSCELRAAADSEFVLEGLAAPYSRPTKIGNAFVEKIAPGAFSRALKQGADVFCLANHDYDKVLGRTSSGTLTLSDSKEGLRFRVQLDRDSPSHCDIFTSVKRGDVASMSFGFIVPPDGDVWNGNSRTLVDVDLREVSIVPLPAYGGTAVDARSRNEDDDPDDEDDPEEEDRCSCECEACKDGYCAACTDENCDDESCAECGARCSAELEDLRAKLAALKI
jgi:HK97 family phage prohead protease